MLAHSIWVRLQELNFGDSQLAICIAPREQSMSTASPWILGKAISMEIDNLTVAD